MVSLRKEPERRYASPAAFAADVVRFQQNFPVVARRNSPLYVVGKNLQRYSVRIAACLVIAASLAFGGISTYKAIHYRIEIEKIRTEVETMRSLYASQPATQTLHAEEGSTAGLSSSKNEGHSLEPGQKPGQASKPELSKDLNILARNLQSTTPEVLRSPLAPRRLTKELVQQSLDLFSAAAPEAIKDPASAAALGRAYLAVSQIQWNSNGASLNQPEEAAKTCKKALIALKSRRLESGNQEVRQVVGQLLGALNRIPPSD
jgi:hypothetical protein